MTLLEEELASLSIQNRLPKKVREILHIELVLMLRLLVGWLPFCENHIVFVGKPLAGLDEVLF